MAKLTPYIESKFRIALTDNLPTESVAGGIQTLLGFSSDDFTHGRVNLYDRIHPGDYDIAAELFSLVCIPARGAFNIRLRHADSRIRCIRGQYRKYPDENGRGFMLELVLQDAKSLWQLNRCQPIRDRLHAVLENTDDYIYFKDRNHVFTGASQTLVKLASQAEHWSDLLGQTDYDVFPEEYADLYYELEKQVFAGAAVARGMQQTLTKDGAKGWVDNRKYPIRDESGEIIGLFGIARDITEQKRTEIALAESEQRFRSIFEQVPMISVQGYDRDRRVIFWNPASEALYGFTREQALGRKLEDLIIPEGMRGEVIQSIADWIDGGPAIPASELTLQDARGNPVDVFSSHVMLYGRNGEPEMYCIDIDISERKRIEEALRISEERHRLLADNATDVIWTMNLAGQLTYVSPSVEKLRGFTAQEVMQQSMDELLTPESAALASNAQKTAIEAIQAGQPFPEFRSELEQPCKDGSTVWVEISTSGMRDSSGQLIGALGVSRDITERKRMEEQVRQLAFHDPLTGLPNRRLLSDRLSQAMSASKRSSCYGALIFLDLDNFKPLNDSHGHEVGDLLLVEVANRLKSSIREMDTVARFGGDEFVVMIRELAEDKEQSAVLAGNIAEKIRAVLAEPYVLKIKQDTLPELTIEHDCSASIGVALFIGHEASQDEILKQADLAMYLAKEAGRNVVKFSPELPQRPTQPERIPANFVKLEWHHAYECGHPLIDAQHQALFHKANQLFTASLSGRPASQLAREIDSLIHDIVQHFHDEEAIFTAAGFPEAAEHAALHRELSDHAVTLIGRFHAGTLKIGELFQYLAYEVVAQHILGADRAFFPYLKTKQTP